MGKVQIQIEIHINEESYEYEEEDSTYEHAESIVGVKLDRRKNYMIIDGEVCQMATWTHSCSGCCEAGDYGGLLHRYKYDEKARCHIGAGCHECGYHGKVRTSMWVPLHG